MPSVYVTSKPGALCSVAGATAARQRPLATDGLSPLLMDGSLRTVLARGANQLAPTVPRFRFAGYTDVPQAPQQGAAPHCGVSHFRPFHRARAGDVGAPGGVPGVGLCLI